MKLGIYKNTLILVTFFISSNIFSLDIFQSINEAKALKEINDINYPQQEDAFTKFTKDFTIEFVYSSKCGFCHKLSYVLNNLQKNNKIRVESITADGGFIQGFENAVYSEKFIKANNIKAFPTIIAKDNNNQRYLIAEGYLSENELKSNIETLLEYVSGGRYE
tara:strand:+ start:15956 stop:16444 length:489 start_codon:yes stop_codon:yes gene_type:complete